jgi:Zn-dependent protease/CBS domain-containing protein
MGKSIRVFRINGIPIGFHPSWFIIFVFLTWSLANGYFADRAADLAFPGIWVLGLATSLMFFASVLAHELGHAFVALRNNIPVKSISLFFLGGVAEIEREPATPGEEFRIAIAGPIVSLALALGFNSLTQVIGDFSYLGSGDFYQATRAASFTGQLVAYGFIAYGVFNAFTGNLVNGIWMGFLGMFLLNIAGGATARAKLQQKLDGIKVNQVMSRDYPSIPGETTLDQLVNSTLAYNSQGTFMVVENERSPGILTLREIAAVPRHLWSRIKAREVMKSLENLVSISPETPVLAALEKMEAADLRLIPVVDGLQIKGILSRENVRHYLKLRTELG